MPRLSISKKYVYLLAFVLLSLSFKSAFADVEIESGSIANIKGTAWANQPNQAQRALSKESVIYENDVVKTGEESSLSIVFKDKTKFDLGSESDLVITKFTYKKAGEEDSITMKILKGSFRFISGLIAKKEPRSMTVGTSVATIGIRGTHVAGEVDPTSARIILMEPENKSGPNKIEVFNEFGSVTIDEPGYGTEIPDAFSPPSPPRRMRLRTVTNLMRSLQSIQRINRPRPRY